MCKTAYLLCQLAILTLTSSNGDHKNLGVHANDGNLRNDPLSLFAPRICCDTEVNVRVQPRRSVIIRNIQ